MLEQEVSDAVRSYGFLTFSERKRDMFVVFEIYALSGHVKKKMPGPFRGANPFKLANIYSTHLGKSQTHLYK